MNLNEIDQSIYYLNQNSKYIELVWPIFCEYFFFQLEAFLRQRYQEVISSANRTQYGFSLSQADSSDDVSKEQLEVMITQVANVFNSINEVKLKHLSLIRESPRWVFINNLDPCTAYYSNVIL